MQRLAPVLATLLLLVLPSLAGALNPTQGGSPSTPVVLAARQVYGSGQQSVVPAADPAFAAAFPRLQLYLVTETSLTPPASHAMAWDPTLAVAYDTTTQFNRILAASGATIGTSGAAILYAKAYAAVANAELDASRSVVGAADSASLGQTVQDPAATGGVGGWSVTLSTWSATNGVLADWTIASSATSLTQASWRVRAIGAGAFGLDLEARDLRAGMRFTDSLTATSATLSGTIESGSGAAPLSIPADVAAVTGPVVATASDADGTTWVARYETGYDVTNDVTALAQSAVAAGVAAYDRQVDRNPNACATRANPNPNWGLASKDADCAQNVVVSGAYTLSCGACRVAIASQTEIHMTPAIKEYLAATGTWTDPVKYPRDVVVKLVIAHEHFHALESYANGVSQGIAQEEWWVEGMARFEETVMNPVLNDDPTATWYGTSFDLANKHGGVNYYQLHPDQSLCTQSYALAEYWGYLYWKEGGLGTVLAALRGINASLTCPDRVAGILDGALASVGSPHTFNDTLRAFATHVYARDYAWGDENGNNLTWWGRYMLPVAEDAQVAGSVSRSVGAYAMDFVNVTGAASVTVSPCGDPGWSYQFLATASDGTLRAIPVTGCGAVSLPAASVVAFNAVRTSGAAASYTLTVSPI
ncbi:MAG: hypothetical protein QOE90_865 [Thermoplasmata archaeon]|jgi:hypothetical protein|nr:hypothetical protein [Thermoplasmata archaeon]